MCWDAKKVLSADWPHLLEITKATKAKRPRTDVKQEPLSPQVTKMYLYNKGTAWSAVFQNWEDDSFWKHCLA